MSWLRVILFPGPDFQKVGHQRTLAGCYCAGESLNIYFRFPLRFPAFFFVCQSCVHCNEFDILDITLIYIRNILG